VQWHFTDDSLAGFQLDLDLAECAIVFTPVQDHTASIFAEEQRALDKMASGRQQAFSSGRWCARAAQELLGLFPQPVLRDERVPKWPLGVYGAITHSKEIAAAAVSLKAHIGVDIEQLDRLHERLYKTLFTKPEKRALQTLGGEGATIMFSAKESGYKAVYPIGQSFIGFQEAEITLNEDDCTFSIDYLGDHPPNEALNDGIGYWRVHQDHVLTMFVIN